VERFVFALPKLTELATKKKKNTIKLYYKPQTIATAVLNAGI
jgi:hypothetical protein